MIFNKQTFINQLFEEKVKETPGAIALSFANKEVTYKELNRRANWISGKLIALGFPAGNTAAVDYQSPLEMAAGIIGVIKAGGAFLPLTLRGSYPKEYILDVLENSQVGYLLTNSADSREIPFNGKTLIFDHREDVEDDYPDPQVEQKKENPLTVIYEFNSRGNAAGISLSHQHIMNWIEFNIEKLNVDFSRTLFISSTQMELGFPLWLANLVTGGEVHFHRWDQKNNRSIPEIIHLIREMKFRGIVCPLSYLQTVLSQNDSHYKEVFPDHLRNITSIGEETFDIKGFKSYVKERKIRWHNYFGFPGITMITTLVEDNETAAEMVFKHIGKLAPHTHAYILSSKKKMTSRGMSGELYVNGKGVMDRYYRNEKLNKAHFLETSSIPGKEIYKTGYTASWLPDWKISISGRTDNRVNVNGCRIVVEAVESALFKHPAVNDCVVVPKKTNNGKMQLTAYLVPKKKGEDETNENLEKFLKTFLPADIFPIGFIRLHYLPRTADGLVDRKYLEQWDRFDSLQVQSLENEIRKLSQIHQAAVRVEEKIERPLPLHLKDYLPGIRPVSPGDIKESSQRVDQVSHESGRSEPAVIHGDELVWEEGEPRTLAEALKRAAAQHGNHGVRFIRADGSTHFQGYSALCEEAERMLTGLRKLGLKPQDKVIFQFNRNEDFVSTFWGCILGGIVPVPMMVPKSLARPNNETETVRRVWELLDKPVVLTNRHLEPSIRSLFKDFQVENIEPLRDNEPGKNWHKSSPDDMAIILFTSGSTGIPKGVVQTHRTLIAREKSTTLFNNGSHKDVSINWMPLEHVGGVVMFHVNDIYMGCQQIQVSTEYILTDPLRWLDIISTYKCTITWAPNFAYGLVNDRIGKKADGNWDLSSMRFILNAGEAINAKTTKKFLTLLAPYGLPADCMKPSWGMSETCSAVVYSYTMTPEPGAGVHALDKYSLSGVIRKSETEADNVNFTQLGKTIPGVSIRITDNNNQVVREGTVGKLQVKGVTVTPGYYKNPEMNKEVFTPDGWFDTGDLAFILNASMTITGRAKDVIIVHGINLNSVEMEAAIEEVEGVETSYTAACAVRDQNSETDKVAVFYHSQYTDFNRKLNQVKQIQKTFVEKFALNLDYVIPVEKEDIPKTSIGKIQRLKLARAFQEGVFDDVVKQIDIGLGNENTLPVWFFKKSWRHHALGGYDGAGKDVPRTCLVFEDDPALGDALVDRLEQENCRCIKVKSGPEFKSIHHTCYQINHREAGDYRRLIETLEKNSFQIDDIFHLYGCREFHSHTIDIDMQMMKEIDSRGVYSLLHLIRALNKTPGGGRRLFVVTSDTQSTSGNDGAAYEKSGISGFLKSAALELDWLHCCHVDLDLDANPKSIKLNAECLAAEWKNPGDAVEVAYREGRRLKPFLSRLDMENEETRDIPIKNAGIYLVTGGLGGIGTHVCKWLQENYDAKLIIIGRTALPERKQWSRILSEKTAVSGRIRAYLALETSGKEFIYAAGDAADSSFLEQWIARAESKWQNSLDGVFHLAGAGNLEHHWQVMDDYWVVKETPREIEAMFQGKVYGALALHQVLKDRKDAIFVGFSSITGFFGSPTFSAYAAANSFLDGFCLYRKYNGWPNTYCINWSSWDNVGMSENNPEPMVKAMLANGYEIILPRQGIPSMWIALSLSPGQLFIGLNPTNSHIRTFMAEYPAAKQVINVYYTTKNRVKIDEPGFRSSISAMISSRDKNNNAVLKIHQIEKMPLIDGKFIDYKQLKEMDSQLGVVTIEDELPQTLTEQKLAKVWREILGKSQIGINDNFFELGGHSLKATTLGSKIHKVFDVIMPLDEIFRNPTIKEMAQYLETKTAKDRYVAIEPVEKKSFYPLSSAQKRLYILHRMEPQSTAYNLFQQVMLPEGIDMERLEEVFIKLVERHESFRTSFHMTANEPVQRVQDQVEFAIRFYDLTAREAENIEDTVYGSFIRPFDLSQPPLMRVGAVRINASPRFLIIEMHHIITDGTSQRVLEKEFMALLSNREGELSPLRLQYKDFSRWQNREEQKELLKQQESYWFKVFSDELPVLYLPNDYPRPLIQSFEGSMVTFVLPEKETQRLKDIAKETDTTLYMIILAVFTVLLSKLSGQEDIIVGTPVAARRHTDLERIIGMFVNTLAIRNYPSGEKSFKAFLREIKKRTLEAFENQEYPFEDLVDQMAVRRDTGRNPIFDVMFNLLNMKDYTGDLPGIDHQDSHSYQHTTNTAIFDLNLTAVDAVKRLVFNLQYCTRLFKKSTIDRITRYFNIIISSLSGDMEVTLADLEIISGEEKRQLLVEFNDTEAQFPGNKTIHRLLEEQAARVPNNIAVVGQSALHPGNSSLTHLSFRELNEKVHGLAILLRSKGVDTDKIVGIITRRSIEMVIGIMAVLKAGGAYLPLEPDYPETRITYIMEESKAEMLLNHLPEVEEFFRGGGGTAPIKTLASPLENRDSTSLAYVIYTSGSTGTPKGAAVEHRSVVNIINALLKKYPFVEKDVYLLKTPCVFDVSVSELFGWFPGGGRLAVLEPGAEKDPQKIIDTTSRLLVSHINFVPSMFRVFVHWLSTQPFLFRQLSSLKYIFLAGEALSALVVNKFRELDISGKIRLENIYGPTEAAVYAAQYSLSEWGGGANIPIGKPLQNVNLYILDPWNHVSPVGVRGELCIAGIGLARGYLNNPESTAEKFDRDKRKKIPGERVYRSYKSYMSHIYHTGDQARWLPDGNIEFLGRIDHQVKVRGFRIEPGEIEYQLLKHDEIEAALVTILSQEDGDQYLCAYIVRAGAVPVTPSPDKQPLTTAGLREYLSQSLPDYMIPSYFVEIEKIPLTPGGKLDRKALPKPGFIPDSEYVAPRNEIEEKLAAVWSEILGLKKDTISIEANFFGLGGHSLKAIILTTMIYKEFNVKLPLTEIFKTSTIKGIASLIKVFKWAEPGETTVEQKMEEIEI
jgi:amino acid adenylation domain-containing protein